MKHNGVFLLVLLASSILLCSFGLIDAKAQADIVVLPDSPIATPAPLSPSAEAALKYVADQHGVSTDDLTVSAGEAIVFPLLGLRYDYYVVAPKWAGKVPIVSLLVDPTTGAIETDMNAIQQKEDEAYAVKYGKLHPTLLERLQTTAADELLPVAVWVAQDEKAKPPEALEAEVAAQFPEAGEALAQNGVAWAVEDSELEIKIFRAYVGLINAETARRVQPVREWLEQKDYKVYEAPGIPLLTATLAAADIEELAKLPQVAQIYLIEPVGQPEADIAVATDRVPAVWRSGYTGVGIKLAILEPGRINNTARACMNVAATRSPGQADSYHKSAVAAMAACNNPTLPGVAPGASILDADFIDLNQPDFLNALIWSVSTQAANIVNVSYRFEYDQALNLTDRAADYMARTYSKTLVKSSGNSSESGPNITSPGKGWNVITVSNISLSEIGMTETANWSDDEMNRDWTAWATAADRAAKPELVAPGTSIDTVVDRRTGSSMSAPQAAGASAFLMQREYLLRSWPTAIKAILMASAVHNIEGERTSGEYDGAGSLDVALAYQITQQRGDQSTVCNSSCWWDIPTSNVNPSRGGEISRYLYATRGERMRVAISWYSQADPGPQYTNDRLLSNYDLYVYAPDGSYVTASTSVYNAYEIVEFVAAQSGQYRIGVYRNSSNDYGEISNSVGMAWSKQASYLPDVRRYADNWTSTIAVRNDGAEPRPARITFFRDDSTNVGSYEATLQPNQSWRITSIEPFTYGAATVDGSENLAVGLLQERSNPYTMDAYAGVGTLRPDIYIPIVHRNNSGWYSDIFVYNPNTQAAGILLTFTPVPGVGNGWTYSFLVVSSGSLRINTGSLPELGSRFVGSVHVAANLPVAVAATQYNGNSQLMALSSSQPLGASLYAPLIQNNNSGWLSGLGLRLPDGAMPFTVQYFTTASIACAIENWWNNPQTVYPAPQGNPSSCGATPSAIINSASGAMAASVNQLQGSLNATTYEAIAVPSMAVSVPRVQRGSGWNDGFVILNTSDAWINVTVRLYNLDGSLYSTPINNQSLGPRWSLTVLSQIPDPFNGSAQISANGNVAVVANAFHPGANSGDVIGSQPGIHR